MALKGPWYDPAGLFTESDAERRAEEAQRFATAQEAAREQRIRRTTAAVDAIFDSPERKQQYQDFVGALRGYFGEQLEREKGDADRSLKFTLARSGLTGGSAAAERGGRLGEEFERGVLESERRAQGALSDLRSSDEQSRLNLIQLAQSGLETTSGAQRAAAAMQSNIGTTAQRARVEGLGDIFADTTGFIRQRAEERGQRRGLGYDVFREDIYGSGGP